MAFLCYNKAVKIIKINMNKKIATELAIGIILIIAVIIGGFIWMGNKKENKNLIYTPSPNESEAKTVRNMGKEVSKYQAGQIEDSGKIIDIAKQYVLKKPQLNWYDGNGSESKLIEWSDNKQIGAVLDEKSIVYLEPTINKMNDKFSVRWFFVPGCKEDVNSDEENNWYDNSGKQCIGGYVLEVLVNKDSHIESASLVKSK